MMKWFGKSLQLVWLGVKSGFQFVYGFYYLSRLQQPIVSIFGGKGAYEEGKYVQWAQDAAARAAEWNMSVITGGGPGIMEAANCGIFKPRKNGKNITLGIGVRGVDEDFINPCAPLIWVDYFFVRKWLLTHYSCGFIIFPGGIGTMDEFFEVLNLIKLKKLRAVPIILIGTSYWHHIIQWYNHAFEYEFTNLPAQSAFIITDDPIEAIDIIYQSYREYNKQSRSQ